MAIPEATLDTWSAIGSIQQSASTRAALEAALLAAGPRYLQRDPDIFLQGSYGNNTNIVGDSDVDLVIAIRSVFYPDISALPPDQVAVYKSVHPNDADYGWQDLHTEVVASLERAFPKQVTPDKKCIRVKGNGSTRRDGDVVAAVRYKKFIRYYNNSSDIIVEGIKFFTLDGTEIVNFPKLHMERCTTKHGNTNQLFKPTVRAMKNLRLWMINNSKTTKKTVPSYFLESLIFNAPDANFQTSKGQTFVNLLNWMNGIQPGNTLMCANGQNPLFDDHASTSWKFQNFVSFRQAAIETWNNW